MQTALTPEQKIDALFKQEFITAEDYNKLTPEEKELCNKKQLEIVKQLEGKELTTFIDKIHQTMPADFNEDLWERNHDRICCVINETMQTQHRLPSKSEIATKTGLSRNTVSKHLTEFREHKLSSERKERFGLMEQTIMTALYTKCIQGDVNAMRFYFEVTGLINKGAGASVIENQHNYIQINNLKLSQEEIQKLSPKQLKQIEAIVKSGSLVDKKGKE